MQTARRALFNRSLVAGLLASASLLMPSLSHAEDSLHLDLKKVMAASTAAWSAGQLDDFMKIYEDGPDTSYISAGKQVKGYAAIRAMYQQRFAGSKPGQLGALSFDLMEIQPLGAEHALLIGRYHLLPEGGKPEYTGLFTLLFHRSKGEWHVINDHTS